MGYHLHWRFIVCSMIVAAVFITFVSCSSQQRLRSRVVRLQRSLLLLRGPKPAELGWCWRSMHCLRWPSCKHAWCGRKRFCDEWVMWDCVQKISLINGILRTTNPHFVIHEVSPHISRVDQVWTSAKSTLHFKLTRRHLYSSKGRFGIYKSFVIFKVTYNGVDQGAPNYFARGPQKLIHKSSRAGHLT